LGKSLISLFEDPEADGRKTSATLIEFAGGFTLTIAVERWWSVLHEN
jgi:hypothetical protein